MRHRPVLRFVLLLFLGLLSGGSLSSCAQNFVSPDFPQFIPRRVAVLPVRNDTPDSLDYVVFSGFLQSALFDTKSYDVPQILRGAVEEADTLKGYEVAPPAAGSAPDLSDLPPAALPSPAAPDAELLTTITSWSSGRGPAAQLAMAYRVELLDVGSGTLLFARETSCVHQREVRLSSGRPLEKILRRCVRRAFQSLPERVE